MRNISDVFLLYQEARECNKLYHK